MKTNKSWVKTISIFIALAFFLQGVPAFGAEGGRTDISSESLRLSVKPAVPLTDAQPAPVEIVAPVDPTTAHFVESPLELPIVEPPLKLPNKEEIYKERIEFWKYRHTIVNQEQVALVKNDLIQTFGFSEKELEAWIAKGLIRFYQTGKTTLAVSIHPSVRLDRNAVNLTDPLGSNDLPLLIKYEFSHPKQVVLLS
jgi:hypothetical protein